MVKKHLTTNKIKILNIHYLNTLFILLHIMTKNIIPKKPERKITSEMYQALRSNMYLAEIEFLIKNYEKLDKCHPYHSNKVLEIRKNYTTDEMTSDIQQKYMKLLEEYKKLIKLNSIPYDDSIDIYEKITNEKITNENDAMRLSAQSEESAIDAIVLLQMCLPKNNKSHDTIENIKCLQHARLKKKK